MLRSDDIALLLERRGLQWRLSLQGESPALADIDIEPDDLLSERDAEEFRWYLEDFLKEGNPTRANAAEASLERLGLSLYRTLLLDRVLGDFRVANPGRRIYLTVASSDPEAFSTPFEIVRNEAGPLFRQGVVIRRRLTQPTPAGGSRPHVDLRVLFLISRPIDAAPIDPRISLDPALQAASLRRAHIHVRVIRPATLRALEEALSSFAEEGEPVDILHLDCHGIQHGDLSIGCLLFEREDGTSQIVDARRLGDLLVSYRVPTVIIEACQSAHSSRGRLFRAVAPRLVQAGCSSVIAMSHSIHVEAARLFTVAYYGNLFSGRTVGEAVNFGRDAMLAQPERSAFLDRQARLVDWFIPQLYQQVEDYPVLAINEPAILADDTSLRRVQLQVLSQGPSGLLVGRAAEFAALDRALATSLTVFLSGIGGIGKSHLAVEVARIWADTSDFENRVIMAEGAALPSLMHALGHTFGEIPRDPVQHVGWALAHLEGNRVLVVWDLGEHTLNPGDEVDEFVMQWSRKLRKAKLLVVARGGNLSAPEVKRVRLGPLSFAGARELLQSRALLEGAPANHPLLSKENMDLLISRSGGHPAVLKVIASRICDFFNATELLQHLPTWCSELTLRHPQALSSRDAEALFRLGIFQISVVEAVARRVTGLSDQEWRSVTDSLEAHGLAEIAEDLPWRPLRLHPSLWGRREITEDVRHTYGMLFADLESLRNGEHSAMVMRLIAHDEANVFSVVQWLLKQGRKLEAASFALGVHEATEVFGSPAQLHIWNMILDGMNADSFLARMQGVRTALQRGWNREAMELLERQQPDGERERALHIHSRGRILRRVGYLEDARRYLREVISIWSARDEMLNLSAALGDLALVELAGGRPDAAREYAEEAVSICTRLARRDSLAAALGQLAAVNIQLGIYGVAEELLGQALALAEASSSPLIYGALLQHAGVLALRLGDFSAACSHLRRACLLAENWGHKAEWARGQNLLGVTYFEMGRREPAVNCFLQAEAGARRERDYLLLAEVQQNRAILARDERDFDSAESLLRESADLLKDSPPSVHLRLGIEIIRLSIARGDSEVYRILEAIMPWALATETGRDVVEFARLCASLQAKEEWSARILDSLGAEEKNLQVLGARSLAIVRGLANAILESADSYLPIAEEVWITIQRLEQIWPSDVLSVVQYLADVAAGDWSVEIPDCPRALYVILDTMRSQLMELRNARSSNTV